jgi:hypothetical protein
MQSNAAPNQIQMSESTARMLMPVHKYKLTKRGIVKVKGKGEVNTYWLNEWEEGERRDGGEDEEAQLQMAQPMDNNNQQDGGGGGGPKTSNSMLGLLNDANGRVEGAAAGTSSNGLRNRRGSNISGKDIGGLENAERK